MKVIEYIYAEAEPSPVAAFQVYMVLAIGSTVLSRRLKISLPADGFCASAMKHFDKLYLENSLKGLQGLLLLLVYTLSSPSMGLNIWYLNYQCIAALLDLGLQRDVRSGKTLSVLDQEMRTRIFWVIYSLDRSVATMMGRPIGLRDEACELRLRRTLRITNCLQLIFKIVHQPKSHHMSYSIHLFKLAQLNSEMKYVLHSVSHEVPPYTYPSIPDMLEWQEGIARRLATWFDEIPQFTGERLYMTKLCEIKYHEIKMLLLRPSPAIPNPSIDSLKSCYESAVSSIRLYDQLYKNDLLVYSWFTVHSVFLSTITMLHYIWTIPQVTTQIKLDVLMADLKAASNVLSASGEHWSEAKRSRNFLDELSGTTIRWIMDPSARESDGIGAARGAARPHGNNSTSKTSGSSVQPAQHANNQPLESYDSNQGLNFSQPQSTEINPDIQDFNPNFYLPFGNDALTGQIDFSDPAAVNAIMHGVFADFQPAFDFGPDYEMDQIMGG